jgi:hypothetical protein
LRCIQLIPRHRDECMNLKVMDGFVLDEHHPSLSVDYDRERIEIDAFLEMSIGVGVSCPMSTWDGYNNRHVVERD